MILELERAERVRDVLERIGRRVREVVHRVDAPRVAGAVVMRAPDAVEHRIAQVDVRRRHVDLRAQHERAVGKLAGAHAGEEIEVLLDRPVAIRAGRSRLGQRAAVRAHLLGRQAVDVRQALPDQVLRVLVQPLEVVRGVQRLLVPGEAEPADVFLNRVDVLDVFLRGVGVVEAQVAGAAELRARRRSSGRSTSRGRCAGSRSARAESGSRRGRRAFRPSRRRRRWCG